MSRIRLLSEQLANQIAAGEVVERPASVVKELLENSLDAGATRIDIQVEGGGSVLLRVADDGRGMDGDDVLLSIERHATSKLKDESQLTGISTLGFRGEAIPSIASVSWLRILSRPRGQDLGTRVDIRYGTLQAVHQDGCGHGTVMEVRNLFGNMPARRKFLKSVRTELSHIEEVVRNLSLAHPASGFRLIIDGRQTLDWPPGEGLEHRVRQVFRAEGPLLPLEGEDGEGLALGGFLLLPESSPATSARLRLLVNGRPVQDGMLRHAVLEGMQGFLMKGYQPAGALLLTVPAEQVDVNVHPAKREIRFRRSEVVHRFVAAAVAQAMAAYQQALRTSVFVPAAAATGIAPLPERTETAEPVTAFYPEPVALPVGPLTTAEPALGRDAGPVSVPGPPVASTPVPPTLVDPGMPGAGATPLDTDTAEDFTGLTLIGQLFVLYLLCEKDGQFIVIDQHAAHERLLYNQLRRGYLESRVPQQTLLFPATVELSPTRAETLEARQAEVEALGVRTEHFGDATWVVTALPAAVSHEEPGGLLGEILDGLRGPIRDEADRPVPRAVDDLLASMACKAAIKAGNRLQPAEMLRLLAAMQADPIFSHCPHGRPVMRVFTAREVEKWFHRHSG
ncbi:MAG: DNA mismatch repair endonuclease MutL [Desulfobulbus sp.]|nr:DNA mismatch repair endonuclease MutL [Desulfobulbus sp.]